jgi:nicotinate-nucleotide adenylyltransferase
MKTRATETRGAKDVATHADRATDVVNHAAADAAPDAHAGILPRRVGILGGTFDPIHNGHLALASQFVELLQLTELILLPAGQPWQKTDVSQAHHRLAMTQLAAQTLHFAHTTVSVATNEIDQNGPTYTTETLAQWRTQEGQSGAAPASLALLIGADQLLKLDTWRNWKQLFEFAHLCAESRPGFDASGIPADVAQEIARRRVDATGIQRSTHGGILIDEALAIDLSATAIRQHIHERLAGRHETSEHVPPAVWHYIRQNHLYRT